MEEEKCCVAGCGNKGAHVLPLADLERHCRYISEVLVRTQTMCPLLDATARPLEAHAPRLHGMPSEQQRSLMTVRVQVRRSNLSLLVVTAHLESGARQWTPPAAAPRPGPLHAAAEPAVRDAGDGEAQGSQRWSSKASLFRGAVFDVLATLPVQDHRSVKVPPSRG